MELETFDTSKLPFLKVLLKAKGQMKFRVATDSMEPVILTTSNVNVTPITAPLEVFDIIVFWDGSRLMCHYVWHINSLPSSSGEKVFVTRGLRTGEDFPINEADILGIVTSHCLPLRFRLEVKFKSLLRRK